MKQWTAEQFWEYVEGLTDTFVRDQMRDMLQERGLAIEHAPPVIASQLPDDPTYDHTMSALRTALNDEPTTGD